MRQFAYGLLQAPADIRLIVPPAFEPLFQGRKRRGQDKDVDRVLYERPGPLCALPVYLQDDILAVGQLLFHPGARGAVQVAKHGGMFKEPALPEQGTEFLLS